MSNIAKSTIRKFGSLCPKKFLVKIQQAHLQGSNAGRSCSCV